MERFVKISGIILLFAVELFLSIYSPPLSISSSAKSLYIMPSFWTTKFLSLGMEGAAADIFFIRTMLYLGEGNIPRNQWNLNWIYGNLSFAVTLDPRFENAYFFGGIVVPQTIEETQRAIAFLEEGRKKNPKDWQLPFWIGFNYYQIGQHQKAAQYYAQASNLPQAPAYLKGLEVMSYFREGDYQSGLAILKALVQSAKNPQSKEWIEAKIKWLENIVYLEDAINRFESIFNRPPKDLNELIQQKFISEVPHDPWLGGYYLDSDTKKVKSLPLNYNDSIQYEKEN